MENLEYANAYSEVNEILKSISKEDYEKIPKSKRQALIVAMEASENHAFRKILLIPCFKV